MIYLLGLNSKLVAFWLKYMGKLQGNIYQVDKEPLINIPIALPNDEIMLRVKDLVLNIISIKAEHRNTDNIENELNKIIFDIYKLSYEDVNEIINTD